MAGYDGGCVPVPADLVLRTNAAPPRGPARRTTILPPAATLVICACRALADRPGRHRAPGRRSPPRRAASPTPSRRDSPVTRQEPGCAPLGVLVIHAVPLQLQLVTRMVRLSNGARPPNVVDRDGALSSRFGIGEGHGRTGMMKTSIHRWVCRSATHPGPGGPPSGGDGTTT
jgi:hypothetical protein